MQHMDVNDLIV